MRSAIEQLNAQYEQTGRAFRAQRVAGGWQVLTLPSLGPLVSRLHRDRRESRLSQAALETLAIVAYRQPITTPEIEAVRGVNCQGVLKSLVARGLVEVTDRLDTVGRPVVYGTTFEFLQYFGLSNLAELPELEDAKPADEA